MKNGARSEKYLKKTVARIKGLLQARLSIRLSFFTLSAVTLLFAAILYANYIVSRDIHIKQINNLGIMLASNVEMEIAKVFAEAESVADSISYALETPVNENFIRTLQQRHVLASPNVYGTCAAYAPFGFSRTRELFAPYTYRLKGETAYKYLDTESYQYLEQDWFRLTWESQKPLWTEPYFDRGGGETLMCTYARPLERFVAGKPENIGVVTADISLGWLQKLVAELKVADRGYAFLLSQNGTFIVHPKRSLVMDETIFSRAAKLNRPDISHLGEKMRAGETAFAEITDLPDVGDAFIYYCPVGTGQWSLGLVFPEEKIFHDMRMLSRDTLIIGIVGFGLLSLVITLLARTISRPLEKLTTATRQIAAGHFDLDLPIPDGHDEVAQLSVAFSQMQEELRCYIANLTAATAARERMESELSIARKIQMEILPQKCPQHNQYEIFAQIRPAREVGGDFYDFFMLDDSRLCFLVGDVSGKGVPAAFFMAVTKTMLKAIATQGLPPEKILQQVNNELARHNHSLMFVTLFLAICDLDTGLLHYANGGHNPPVHLGSSGKIQWIPSLREPMLGPMEDFCYSSATLNLAHGDTIFIYTDGVTEAMNTQKELYTEQRLLTRLTEMQKTRPKIVIDTIEKSVDDFIEDAAQSDDITMLAVQFLQKGEQSNEY